MDKIHRDKNKTRKFELLQGQPGIRCFKDTVIKLILQINSNDNR